MEYILIVVGTLLIVGVIVYLEQKYKRNVSILLETTAKKYGYQVESCQGKPYEFRLIKDEKIILISVVKIPSNSAITINAKDTWCLTWGGSTQNPGRSKPNKRFLEELKPFLMYKSQSSEYKVIMLYRSTEKLQKYLNECEIELVSFGERCYDYYVIPYQMWEEGFEKIK